MEQESSIFVRIVNQRRDKILLSYPNTDKFNNWEVYHLGDNEVCYTNIVCYV